MMEMGQNVVGTSFTFLYVPLRHVLRELHAMTIANKLRIRKLTVNFCEINRLADVMLYNFENLTDLNLSNCGINNLNTYVFSRLIYLNAINLNFNSISFIPRNLFDGNRNLETILLQDNLLVNIGLITFSFLNRLETLDLSYNFIEVLGLHFLDSRNIKVLKMNNNCIRIVLRNAFYELGNLTHLFLNNNEIEELEDNVFRTNRQLIELDLFNNNLRHLHYDIFNGIESLESLSLTVTHSFNIITVERLRQLRRFYLTCKRDPLVWTNRFRRTIENFRLLTVLKLVCDTVELRHLCDFSRLQQLEHLHIECKEPNNDPLNVDSSRHFRRMPHLEHLVLDKLNAFRIIDQSGEIGNLRHLSLSGIKNERFHRCFSDYVLLEFLDLSFSKIELILPSTFRNLVHLRHLKLQHTNLRSIESTAFQHNVELQVLICSNCRLETIEDDSFINLHSLRELDLSGNRSLQISHNTFNRLNGETCAIIL